MSNVCEIVKDEIQLRKPCKYVTKEICDEFNLWDKLKETCLTIPNALGLAANQIGFDARASLVLVQDGKGNIIREMKLLNPEILEKKNLCKYEKEGCLSFPDVFINTWRYNNIKIKDDFNGEQDFSGIMAVIIQHEIDHMDGKLFFDVKTETFKRTEAKIGRNDPCPCKSGKKYKKCCLK